MYKWIAAESELKTESELQDKIWAGLPTAYMLAKPAQIFLLFTFKFQSTIHF